MAKRSTRRRLQKSLVVFARITATITLIGVLLVLIPLSVPRFLGYQTFQVISPSMEPELPVGSLILVKPVDPHDVEEGEIIAFYSNGNVVSHRVVKNNSFENKFVTKGDANETEDLVDPLYTELIGVVTHHYPVFGSLGAYFSTGSGKLLLAELVICAALLYLVASKIKI